MNVYMSPKEKYRKFIEETDKYIREEIRKSYVSKNDAHVEQGKILAYEDILSLLVKFQARSDIL